MAKLLAVFSATWKGLPLIYSGQELPNHKRLQFFEKDSIVWNQEAALHLFYKTLLELRKAHAALHAGGSAERIQTRYDDQLFAFKRAGADEEIIVVLNFSERPVDVSLIPGNILFASPGAETSASGLRLDAWGWTILMK
jgi:alpha-amylase